MNFENLTVEFHVPYVLNMHIKFHSNRMLFTIRLILFFIYNFKLQKFEKFLPFGEKFCFFLYALKDEFLMNL